VARVSWSKVASREFWEIVGYIEQHSPRAALAVGDALEDAADRLAEYPLLGRVVSEYSHRALRELIVRDYRLMYRLVGDEVRIITVFHGSRDLMEHLPEGPWDIE